jgi:hypothetical protein
MAVPNATMASSGADCSPRDRRRDVCSQPENKWLRLHISDLDPTSGHADFVGSLGGGGGGGGGGGVGGGGGGGGGGLLAVSQPGPWAGICFEARLRTAPRPAQCTENRQSRATPEAVARFLSVREAKLSDRVLRLRNARQRQAWVGMLVVNARQNTNKKIACGHRGSPAQSRPSTPSRALATSNARRRAGPDDSGEILFRAFSRLRVLGVV